MRKPANDKVFIPLTDELLYDRPELITAPLLPFTSDHPCFHWQAEIETVERDKPAAPKVA